MHLLMKRYLDIYAVTSEIWFSFYFMSQKKHLFYIAQLKKNRLSAIIYI